jgi:protease I
MADKKLTGIRVLMVIAPAEFRDEELLEPKRILTEAGAHVTVSSTKPGEATGMLGAKVTPETTLDKVQAAEYHALVVVGGMGSPKHLWECAPLHNIVRQIENAGRVIGGICLSGAVLAKAGVLRNKQATVWSTPESLQALSDGGAKYTSDHVVQDGNVVTADGPEAATKFGETLVEMLVRTTAKV